MRAGLLDRRIAVERATITVDSFNNPVPVWATLLVVSALKVDVRDSERIASLEAGAEIGTRFTVRWSRDMAEVTPKDRVVCEGRTYQIVGIKEIGFGKRQEGFELTTVARID
jgi:head-tail adaptor